LGAEDVSVEGDYVTVYTTPAKLEEVPYCPGKRENCGRISGSLDDTKQTIDLDEKQYRPDHEMLENLEGTG